jgi:elongator complex protein 1
MKNLKLYGEISQNLELQSPQEVLLFSAFDIERNRLFFASSANIIYTAHLSSFQVFPLSILLFALCTHKFVILRVYLFV